MTQCTSLVLCLNPTGIQKEFLDYVKESRCILKVYTSEQLSDWKKVDLYHVLDIEAYKDSPLHIVFLKNQQKKAIYKYHPDKNKKSSKEVAYLIDKAFSILSDENRRFKYDSYIFDESIPEERNYNTTEFFEVFGPIFEKNLKYSTKKDMPLLGNKETPLQSVQFFYKSWRAFESKRSFDYFFVTNSMDNMNSYQRKEELTRQKNNIKKKSAQEIQRISRLVEMAYNCDPRLNHLNQKSVKEKLDIKNIKINPKLISNGWTENEIKILGCLIEEDKNKKQQHDWENLFSRFNLNNDAGKNYNEFLVKGKEIIRMGIKKSSSAPGFVPRKRK
ncbi:hypothetical protein EDEG_00032 [Edhazardia aedis USNM 41457]|uniref:J domain-containing protein n=1 Tax=Edhazardia aedis (strain USNM 41457) TaxID=1003232 RepID=J8ZP11_EDHAE|nr:hypothetical protein EDEG_00032 [Edhazardia aedis USNM 41457]|eukprot:EJW01438.1 hypothetical protein EDEG_00032 [Edhazardia aedis USNM 41457]